MDISAKIKAELKDLKGGGIYLIITKAVDYERTNDAVLKYLINTLKMNGIYVTLNKPYITMRSIFEKSKIDLSRIVFLDVISKTILGDVKSEKNVQFLDSPEDLTNLSIAVNILASGLQSPKFLFFDSLSTLLVYNAIGPVTRFAHFLVGRMRKWQINGVIISIEEETDSKLLSELSQFCDSVIRV